MTVRSRPSWPLGTHSGSSDAAFNYSQKTATWFRPHNKPTLTRWPLEYGSPAKPLLSELQQQVNASLSSPGLCEHFQPGRTSQDGGGGAAARHRLTEAGLERTAPPPRLLPHCFLLILKPGCSRGLRKGREGFSGESPRPWNPLTQDRKEGLNSATAPNSWCWRALLSAQQETDLSQGPAQRQPKSRKGLRILEKLERTATEAALLYGRPNSKIKFVSTFNDDNKRGKKKTPSKAKGFCLPIHSLRRTSFKKQM